MRKLRIIAAALMLAIFVSFGATLYVTSERLTEAETLGIELIQQNEELSAELILYKSIFDVPAAEKKFQSPIALDDFLQYTSPFGERYNPMKKNTGGETKYHPAVDMTGVYEARVTAIGDGVVIDKWYSKGWHNGVYYSGHEVFDGYVRIRHESGEVSGYGHLGTIYVREGQTVYTGMVIGRIGETVNGQSTGPHLHFSVRAPSGEPLQPFKYVNMP